MTEVGSTYCQPRGHDRGRGRLRQHALRLEARLHPGAGGIFELRVNGPIATKRTRGHFPDAAVIADRVSRTLFESSQREVLATKALEPTKSG
jgi:selenoprotein W-related protein